MKPIQTAIMQRPSHLNNHPPQNPLSPLKHNHPPCHHDPNCINRLLKNFGKINSTSITHIKSLWEKNHRHPNSKPLAYMNLCHEAIVKPPHTMPISITQNQINYHFHPNKNPQSTKCILPQTSTLSQGHDNMATHIH